MKKDTKRNLTLAGIAASIAASLALLWPFGRVNQAEPVGPRQHQEQQDTTGLDPAEAPTKPSQRQEVEGIKEAPGTSVSEAAAIEAPKNIVIICDEKYFHENSLWIQRASVDGQSLELRAYISKSGGISEGGGPTTLINKITRNSSLTFGIRLENSTSESLRKIVKYLTDDLFNKGIIDANGNIFPESVWRTSQMNDTQRDFYDKIFTEIFDQNEDAFTWWINSSKELRDKLISFDDPNDAVSYLFRIRTSPDPENEPDFIEPTQGWEPISLHMTQLENLKKDWVRSSIEEYMSGEMGFDVTKTHLTRLRIEGLSILKKIVAGIHVVNGEEVYLLNTTELDASLPMLDTNTRAKIFRGAATIAENPSFMDDAIILSTTQDRILGQYAQNLLEKQHSGEIEYIERIEKISIFEDTFYEAVAFFNVIYNTPHEELRKTISAQDLQHLLSKTYTEYHIDPDGVTTSRIVNQTAASPENER